MISFFILTPYDLGEIGPLGQSFSIPGQWLGPMGLFTAILVAIISTRIFVAITRKGLIIKMPENVPEFISKSFSSLIPGIAILTLFTIISAVITSVGYGSIHEIIYKLIQVPLTSLGSGIWSAIFVAVVAQLLWFWAAWPRYHPRYRSADLVCHGCPAACCVCCRRRLTQHHRLCVLYDLWRCWRFIAAGYNARFFAKSARYKTLGKIALPPAIFTIGEPMAYGVPLVMNLLWRFLIFYQWHHARHCMVSNGHWRIASRRWGEYPGRHADHYFWFYAGELENCRFPIYRTFARFAGWYFFFKTADLVACREENQTDTI